MCVSECVRECLSQCHTIIHWNVLIITSMRYHSLNNVTIMLFTLQSYFLLYNYYNCKFSPLFAKMYFCP